MVLPIRRALIAMLSSVLITGLLAVPALAEDARVADSADPTIASIDVAARNFADGSVDALVVGRNDQFADNLGGSALAGLVGGPLLLTNGGPDAPIRPEVMEQINNLLAPNSPNDCDSLPADVYLLGGENAVSAEAEEQIRIFGWCVERLAGPSRVETSVAVAKRMRAIDFGFGDVSVARADNFADSAAAGAYGSRFGRPIVLTPGDQLHPAVDQLIFGEGENEGLQRLGFVEVLGGTGAISAQVYDDIASRLPGGMAGRTSGGTRDETAVVIARNFHFFSEEEPPSAGVALVNGYSEDGWVYALIAGAVAKVTDAPVVYVQADSFGQPLTDYLLEFMPGSITTYGPVERITDEVSASARQTANNENNISK